MNADGNGLVYRGSLVYKKQGNDLMLESVGFNGGRLVTTVIQGRKFYVPNYYLTDHLGSVRVVVDVTGKVLERNDFYPFGMRWAVSSSRLSANRHRYNGKEEQGFLGLPYTDYGARMLDSRFRLSWGGGDPLAEQDYPTSPYAFCRNNPLRFFDPDGRKVYFAPGVSQEFKSKFAATVKYMNERGTSGDIAALERSQNIYYINEVSKIEKVNFSPADKTISWDSNHMVQTDKGVLMSPATVLAHEADHAQKYDEVITKNDNETTRKYNESAANGSDDQYKKKEEKRVITGSEQNAARRHGEIKKNKTTRENHKGVQAPGNVSNMTPAEISRYIYENNNQYID